MAVRGDLRRRLGLVTSFRFMRLRVPVAVRGDLRRRLGLGCLVGSSVGVAFVAVRGDLRRRLGPSELLLSIQVDGWWQSEVISVGDLDVLATPTSASTIKAKWQSEVISVGDLDETALRCRRRRPWRWQSEVISVGDLDQVVLNHKNSGEGRVAVRGDLRRRLGLCDC